MQKRGHSVGSFANKCSVRGVLGDMGHGSTLWLPFRPLSGACARLIYIIGGRIVIDGYWQSGAQT